MKGSGWVRLAVAGGALLLFQGCSKEAVPTASAETKQAEAPKSGAAAKSAPAQAEVAWKGYEEGLAEAKSSNRPVCLIFYTDWCPHCQNYKKVFTDPKVIEASQAFVMIRLNRDKEPAISAKYAPDGEYIPRTYFLKPDGTLMADVTEDRPNYKYFYDEHDPASVLKSMNAVAAMKF